MSGQHRAVWPLAASVVYGHRVNSEPSVRLAGEVRRVSGGGITLARHGHSVQERHNPVRSQRIYDGVARVCRLPILS